MKLKTCKTCGYYNRRNPFVNQVNSDKQTHDAKIRMLQVRVLSRDALITELSEQNRELLEACTRALPWIGKMIVDGGHLGSVAPQQCVKAMQMMEAAIRAAEGDKS